MRQEQLITEKEKTASVEQEAPVEISPDVKKQEILQEAEKEVAGFEKDGEIALQGAEKTAEADGLKIDPIDKNGLEDLNQKAETGQKELEGEIGRADEKYSDEKKEIFSKFAENRKSFYREIGVDVLTEANWRRKSAEEEVERTKGHIEKYLAEVEALRSEIGDKKSSIINRILEFRQIKKLEKKLGFKKDILSDREKELSQREELVGAYDFIITEEEGLRSLMEEAHVENANFDENKRQEFLEDEKKRDIKNLIAEHKVFFVHDIVDAEWKPSANNRAVDTRKLDFNDQLDILHGLDPTISVSTLHEGSKQETFGGGSWGVFLSGGRVLGGEQSDAATVAYGLKDRRLCSSESAKTESIEKAISRNGKSMEASSYNELIIENPEIAGVYVKWDDSMPELVKNQEVFLKNNERSGYDRWWKTLGNVMKRGMPIFILDREKNKTRMMYDINVKERSFKVTPEYDPENFSNMPGIYQQHLGKDEKRKAVMRVFDKATGLISEDEKEKYTPDGTEQDGRGLYNIN